MDAGAEAFNQLKAVIDTLSDSIYWLDTKKNYIGCNQAYLAKLNLTSLDQLIGRSAADFMPHEQWLRFLTQCDKVLDSQEPLSFNEERADDNDKTALFHISIQPLIRDKKNFGLVIKEQNITSLKSDKIKTKQFEDESPVAKKITDLNHRNLETYLNNIIKHIPASVYWKDKNFVIIGGNLLHAQLCGFSSSEEVIGKTDYDFPWKNEADAIIANDRKVMETRETCTFEESGVLSDYKVHTFLTKKSPLINDKNEVVGLLGISVDMTEKKEFEEKIRQANASKARLIFSIGHLIRSPLTSILGTAQVLQHTKMTNKQMQAVNIIENSAKKIPPILERIQFYIDLENGEEKNAEADFELKPFFERHWNQHQESIKAKSLRGHFEYDEHLPAWVNAGSYFLSLIVDNLMSNAVKYTSKGDIFLKVSQTAQQGDMVTIKVEITDTGIGMRPETQQQLFSLLEPNKGIEDPNFTNSGLRLSITAKMVELLNGTIAVNSTLNKGTTFIVEIPARIIEAPVFAYTSDYAYFYSQSQTPRLRRSLDSLIKVLVIEDDILAQRVIKMMLEEEYNCRIDQAYNLVTAKELMNNHYDIVFVDMNLPDGSGLDFVKLMAKKQKEHPPIIAVTAHASEEEKIKMVENGVIDIIVKPVDLAILKLVVNSYVFEEQPTEED